ncbi:MAG: hypothetical protein HWN80_01125 [Candidatus Lokiarchaeota archaeon]|nr:hypothetical protein [Candidatus Lokiarchaeota archaeon]
MSRKNAFKRLFLITFTFTTIFLCTWVISINIENNFAIDTEQESALYNFQYINNLKSSDNGDSLDYSSIHQNETTAYRLFESIKFDINASKFTNPDYAIMQIRYSNNDVGNFNMVNVTGNDNFTYTYTPRYYDPIGFQNVCFLIYNTDNDLLSSSIPITNFTITSNYLLLLNSTEYNKNDTLYAELIVNNEPQPYDFNWNVTIVDSDNETLQRNLFDVGNNIMQFSFELDDMFNYTNDFYYIKINMTDSSGIPNAAAYYPFRVLNSLPEIIIPSISFSESPLKRAEDCTIRLNVSDSDIYTLPENLTVDMTIQTSTGVLEDPIELTNHNNWTFSTTFSIDIAKPVGIYQVHVEVEDQYGGKDNTTVFLLVENNPPEIYGYFVNGFNIDQSVSVNYGENLIFSFNVSDVENTIEYITVSLLDAENNWYNISRVYLPGMKITIRTEELITGVWYVYLSVTDVDGATTFLNTDYDLAPQEINIIPDLLTPVLPWIGFIIGLLIGVLAGVGILYKKFKTRYIETKETPSKKPSKPSKPSKPTLSKKQVVKEETEKVEAKERKEISKEPQRKIKRKLK